MKIPERIIPTEVDLRQVFRSPHLRGIYNLRPIPQTKPHTCGAAAVATVLNHMGMTANEEMCAQSLHTNTVVGTTVKNILQYFHGRGLETTAFVRFPVAELIGRACSQRFTLVDWADWGGHWVVVAGYEPLMKVIVLADPARPQVKFSAHKLEDFEKYWVCPDFKILGDGILRQLAIIVDRPAKKISPRNRWVIHDFVTKEQRKAE